MSARIVEHRTMDGVYGIEYLQMIVDHQEHGRLLLTEGFGGHDTPEGGQYRWKHGLAAKLHPGDTFADLDAPWNDHTDTIGAVLGGHDDSRPVQEWRGYIVSALAEGAR